MSNCIRKYMNVLISVRLAFPTCAVATALSNWRRCRNPPGFRFFELLFDYFGALAAPAIVLKPREKPRVNARTIGKTFVEFDLQKLPFLNWLPIGEVLGPHLSSMDGRLGRNAFPSRSPIGQPDNLKNHYCVSKFLSMYLVSANAGLSFSAYSFFIFQLMLRFLTYAIRSGPVCYVPTVGATQRSLLQPSLFYFE
jgi:hypothetical protein